MNKTLKITMIAAAMAAGTVLHAQTLPLKELPGIDERDHWLPDEVNQDGLSLIHI